MTVTKDGKLLFDKAPVPSVEEAAARLGRWNASGTDVAVVINADRSVEHGQVVELMDAVRQAGITRIAVAVKPKDR